MTGPSESGVVRPDLLIAPSPLIAPDPVTAPTPSTDPTAPGTSTGKTPPDASTGPTEWEQPGDEEHGVGPHPRPWPDDDRFDPELLALGDRRNVVDRYRYWRREAIVADLDRTRFPFEVAIENLGHDYNIGTVVRTANAFAAARVHIVGRRRWNRRGAMVTDRYQHLEHHTAAAELAAEVHARGLTLVAVDNLPGAVPLERTVLPERAVLLFGAEGPGLSAEALAAADLHVSIAQFGSTRSINVGVAAGIVMHAWIRDHAGPVPADG